MFQTGGATSSTMGSSSSPLAILEDTVMGRDVDGNQPQRPNLDPQKENIEHIQDLGG